MIEWNKVIYADCMNPINGLPTLPDKSIDLGFVDPQFNVKYKKKTLMKDNVIPYNDNIENYEEWCRGWLNELLRICNTVLIHCGKVNISLWYSIKLPYDIIFWHPSNASSSFGKASWVTLLHPFLCYGKFGKRRLNKDLYSYPLTFSHKNQLIHPCPLNNVIVEDLISQLKPTSVIDCFMGSGTTAEVCTKLGIKWLGYEINEVYSQDITTRLKNCKKELTTIQKTF